MAIQSEPTRIQIPFADSGTKNVIPDTNSTPSASQAASWTDGFPAQCSLPLSAGGIPPARADFNGIFNTMTQSIRFGQEGGVWEWDATVDYGTNRVVLGSDGLLYWSIAQSGPNVGGAQDPTADASHTYWISPKVPTMPASDSSASAVNSAWTNSWYASLVLPANLYVDAVNGNNSNDGKTAATALKTIAAVESLIASTSQIRPASINVHVAAGTYTDRINGIFGTSINYTFASGAIIPAVYVDGSGKNVYLTGTVEITGIVQSLNNASVYLGANNASLSLTFNGSSAPGLLRAQSGSLRVAYYTTGITIAFTNSCAASVGTVYSETDGSITFNHQSGASVTWTGTVTGKRYNASICSFITGVGGANVIPGTAAGTADSTSYYS